MAIAQATAASPCTHEISPHSDHQLLVKPAASEHIHKSTHSCTWGNRHPLVQRSFQIINEALASYINRDVLRATQQLRSNQPYLVIFFAIEFPIVASLTPGYAQFFDSIQYD